MHINHQSFPEPHNTHMHIPATINKCIKTMILLLSFFYPFITLKMIPCIIRYRISEELFCIYTVSL